MYGLFWTLDRRESFCLVESTECLCRKLCADICGHLQRPAFGSTHLETTPEVIREGKFNPCLDRPPVLCKSDLPDPLESFRQVAKPRALCLGSKCRIPLAFRPVGLMADADQLTGQTNGEAGR